jgi:predicted transcriptional regulator YdeE
VMQPELIACPPMVVLGIDVTTSNAAEADSSTAKLPGLWARFYQERVIEKIPGTTLPALPVGVYTDYESDHMGRYRVLVGAVVKTGAVAPQGLIAVTLPAGQYLVFRGTGEMPGAVTRTWQAVWSHFATPGDHARAFTADFELYRSPDMVDIFIAVKDATPHTNGLEI